MSRKETKFFAASHSTFDSTKLKTCLLVELDYSTILIRKLPKIIQAPLIL